MKAEDFMAKTKPRGGRLLLRAKEAEIMAMVQADYAYHQIVLWLSMCGIGVEIDAVREFVNEMESLAVRKDAGNPTWQKKDVGGTSLPGTSQTNVLKMHGS